MENNLFNLTEEQRASIIAYKSEVQEKLKEVKDEWLENKPKGGKYLGVNTVRQILDNASPLGWTFELEEQWKEEVYKKNRQTQGFEFDGYVFHVKGVLTIPFLGSRSQYGSKVAIGGINNQDSAYKAAASNCLNKCASLFGVGESVYSKIQVETGESEYNQVQQSQDYSVGQQQGYPQQAYSQPQEAQQQYSAYGQQQQQQATYGQQQGGYPRQQ